MAIYDNPKIVTDGLVLCLDAGNRKSYPGSGTAWTDLSGRGNNGTLQNNPTFSNANSGSLIFDGTNDHMTLNNLTLNTNTGMTIDMWVYCVDPQPVYANFWAFWHYADNFPFGIYASVSGQGKFFFKDDIQNAVVQTPYIGNQWAHVCFTLSGTTPNLYTNGVFSSTASNFRNRNITFNELCRNQSGDIYISIRKSRLSFYNRALSAAEVAQNFNATRKRFGI